MRYVSTYLDLLLAAVLAATTVIVVNLLPEWHSAVRVGLGLVLVLWLPGYTLVMLLFPRKNDLEPINRIALSIGLSTVLVALAGYGLDYTPWGIQLASMSISLGIVVALLALLCGFQRRRLAPEHPFTLPLHSSTFLKSSAVALTTALLFGIGISTMEALRARVQYTEFYILGVNGEISNYPTELSVGEPFTITLGVTNHEGRAASYRVEGSIGTVVARDAVPLLQDGETWERPLALRAPRTVGPTELLFDLYESGGRLPYRSLHLAATVGPANE